MRLLLFCLIIMPFTGIAQKYKEKNNQPNRPTAPCTLPGMLPQTAIAVCGTMDFKQNSVAHCDGQTINTNSTCAGGGTSRDSYWYKFRCYTAGSLGFLIKPDVLSDDYDWELFDVTGIADLDQVYTNESLMVSLNLCGSPNGVTGCRSDGITNVNCGGATNLINKLADLQLNHDYLLMVTNWSTSGTGYTLSFSGGTAVITENIPPVISNVQTAGCNSSKLKVTFSKDIKCSTVSLDGSEFTVLPAGPAVTSVNSGCAAGFSSITNLEVNLASALTPGNYSLRVGKGSVDNNTFSDVCDVFIADGFDIPFVVGPVPPTTVTGVTYSGCAPTILDVQLSRPIFCNSISADGSEFAITPGTPTPPVILSAQYTCANGGTPSVRLTLQNPLMHGNYQLALKDGTDGNGLVDTCGRALANGNAYNLIIPQTTVAPVIQSVGFDECHPDQLVLNFDKAVACGTLSPVSGTEFVITPGTWTVNTLITNCTGVYTKQVTLLLQNPLPGGNYTVNINGGTDGTTIADTCYAFTAPGYNFPFTATQAPAPIFDSVQFDKCEPSSVKLFYSHPIRCSSIAPDGSDYTVTGASGVTVTAASTDPATCGAGYTRWVTLQFSQPITVPGNYLVHNGMGSDGSGVIDTCGASQNTTETIGFTTLGKPSAGFISVVQWGCEKDTITFSHSGGNGVNSWEWVFSDGSTASGQTVTRTFPITSATITAQLMISNGTCGDTHVETITLGNTFAPAFSKLPKDTACLNEPVAFTDESVGSGLQYLWDFGDGSPQSPGQNVPPHIYTNPGVYIIQLIVSDSHGCKDTASSKLFVADRAKVDFTGLQPQYCTDKTITLYRVISPNIISYTWNNGNGLTLDNRTFVQFSYPNEGVYTITLTANDKYCTPAQMSKTVAIYKTPVLDLGRDTVLCPASPLLLGVPPTSGYAYYWNTGAITSQVLTDIFTRYYKLTVDNHGCKAESDINVKVLPACLIKVPTAFTPNNDGINDQLKAVNADLATNFSLQVFNRMGQAMFKTNNPLEGWDGIFKGNPADAGTYVWQLRYTDPWSGKDVFEKGTSILIR